MDLLKSEQVSEEVIESNDFDLFITTVGCENRSSWLISNFNIKARKKIALLYPKNNRSVFSRKNIAFFKEKKLPLVEINPDDNSKLIKIFSQYIDNHKSKDLTVLIDYSMMTKIMYFGLIKYISELEDHPSKIEVFFNYTPVKYSKIRKPKTIKKSSSLNECLNKANSKKPTALIIGLGIEAGRSFYLKNQLKPDNTILFYADPAPEGYVETVFENNAKIIEDTEMRNMLNFSLSDIDNIMESLTSLVLELRLKYRIIIAPLGPKSFALVSMLIASRYPDVDIWRLSSGTCSGELKREPVGHSIVLKSSFVSSEEYD